MSQIGGPPNIAEVALYSSNTDQGGPELGQYVVGRNGKGFRYVKAGGTALVVGNALQAQAVDTQFTNMAIPATTAAGLYVVTVTNGTTVLVANELVDGSLSVYTTPNLCEEYTILANSSAANGAAITLTLDQPLRTAWSTATKVNLRWSPYWKVIQSPASTLTGIPVGVAIYPIAAGEFGWVQTHGVCSALSDGSSILVGSQIALPSGTAGAVILSAAGLANIGTALQAAASGHGIAVNLTVD